MSLRDWPKWMELLAHSGGSRLRRHIQTRIAGAPVHNRKHRILRLQVAVQGHRLLILALSFRTRDALTNAMARQPDNMENGRVNVSGNANHIAEKLFAQALLLHAGEGKST
jgi:hypothetical protein